MKKFISRNPLFVKVPVLPSLGWRRMFNGYAQF